MRDISVAAPRSSPWPCSSFFFFFFFSHLGRIDSRDRFRGGGQERGYRHGTENTPMIAGLGEGARLATETLPERALAMRSARDAFEALMRERFGAPSVLIQGVDIYGNSIFMLRYNVVNLLETFNRRGEEGRGPGAPAQYEQYVPVVSAFARPGCLDAPRDGAAAVPRVRRRGVPLS